MRSNSSVADSVSPMSSAASSSTGASRETLGLWFGALGVLIFALTLPMTRLAVGPAGDPQLPPLFVTAGRAGLAGLLSIAYLVLTAAPRPHGPQWRALAIT